MSFLTYKEKGLTIFLLCIALIGSIIGNFRHNWFGNPKILLSPENLPSTIQTNRESEIIQRHNLTVNRINQIMEDSQRQVGTMVAEIPNFDAHLPIQEFVENK